ncbi:hypothetical protein B9G55_01540 [Saccharibacillus sp. O16]|nr:hypothetical protein B9G55_01540 [Saccharibacillus sp. O16]
MNTYKELTSNEEFFAAALLQVEILVVDAIEKLIVSCDSTVEKYTDFSVRIGGVYYQRDTHLFKVST